MFLYVFDGADADDLVRRGLTLVNHDYNNHIFVFERPGDDFSIDCPHVFSDSMSFLL